MPEPVSSPGAVVLIGAPGAGKSHVGRLLSAELAIPFVDVDTVIESRQRRRIADIFATDGEASFRQLEQQVTLELLAEPGRRVVSLGGGAPMNPEIAAALTGHRVIWLQVSASSAAERVGLNVSRPLLLGNVRGRLVSLMKERVPTYTRLADQVIDTDGYTVKGIVAQIKDALDDGGLSDDVGLSDGSGLSDSDARGRGLT